MGARSSRPRLSGRLLVAAVCLGLVALMVGIALAGGGSDSPSPSPAVSEVGRQSEPQGASAAPATKPGVAMRLAATAEVWVCLLDASAEPLVDGQILAAGEEAGPFRSANFEVALGNGSVTLFVDGEPAEIPESSSPVGYEIDGSGELAPLEEGERPDCE
jgi:hypothetical protein